ncbi:Gfo/Idh/MocA family oxidoreductase [Rubellicoccus peritrichatus]|uniref:Gfo/Idh/MocA family oxidoreductase n=1 Tax=Rubellicoccus peritrichatus TaxID=3080537 RepID=A0AAQ3LAY6_9BACT|nr:Gfo/Idh/MocA family oxidoreductase [Puniceicoccus sp. CR14]WOO41922.1 Gfo/Idh/MocA family oxidoreductase [Puniceicoccus sp. CR14]
MEDRKIKIGAIGLGLRLTGVLQHLLGQSKNIELAAVCDTNDAWKDWATEQGMPMPESVTSHDDLVQRSDIEWIFIGSPNCLHREHVCAALDAGKHVFAEKPLATNLEDTSAMLESWRRSGCQFIIGFTLRFSPHYRKIKALLDEGVVGELISFEFNETIDFNHGGFIMGGWRNQREYSGTHLLEKCCHDIDLANWMTESRASRVASFGGLNFFKPENAYHIERVGKNADGKKAFQLWSPESHQNPFTCDKNINDNQVAIIEYENGVRATFHANCNAAILERRMYILGSEGAIRADVITGNIEVKRIGFEEETRFVETGASGGHGGGDEVLAAEVAEAMFHGKAPSFSMMEGALSAATVFALDDACDSGQVVDCSKYLKALTAENVLA